MQGKNIQKFQQFINEGGIQGMKKMVEGYTEAEIYFHQDTDGVMSALAIKDYLERYGVKTIDAHIIQYGGMSYAIKYTKKGALPVLVDFAHGKSWIQIHTDHHDSQAGVVTKASSFKTARSNAETLSGEVSPSDIFTATDIELIQTVDSANFFAKGIKPEDVPNAIFELDPAKSGQENRLLMGFATNRLLLAYKNKEITGKSLNGKQYKDKNFLECLVLDSNPSLHSMYNNIKNYVNNFNAINWSRSDRKYLNSALTTPEELMKNLNIYQDKMVDYKNLTVDEEYNIAVQYGGGSLFNPGAYDRYTVFKNYPDINFYSIVWPIGLVQVSCNPFKEKILKQIHLGDIAKEAMAKYERMMKRVRISVLDVKKESEKDMEGISKKFDKQGREYDERVGFKFDDLKAFYSEKVVKFEINKEKTAKAIAAKTLEPGKSVWDSTKVDIDNDKNLKNILNKRHSKLTYAEKKSLMFYTIDSWSLIMGNSGGHPSITNLQGWNYLMYASKNGKIMLEKMFGSSKYTDIMKRVQSEVVDLLKQKIDEHEKAGDMATANIKDEESGTKGGLSYESFKYNESRKQELKDLIAEWDKKAELNDDDNKLNMSTSERTDWVQELSELE